MYERVKAEGVGFIRLRSKNKRRWYKIIKDAYHIRRESLKKEIALRTG